MDLGLIGQAVVMFAVTNVDDIVVLALFFSARLLGIAGAPPGSSPDSISGLPRSWPSRSSARSASACYPPL